MNVEIHKLGWGDAYASYAQAREALRNHPEAKHLKIASRAYWHMKKGRGVLDVFLAMKKSGLNADGEPKLAIAPSTSLKGFFRKSWDAKTDCFYTHGGRRSWDIRKQLELPPDTFSPWPRKEGSMIRRDISSPCPIVPPKFMPTGDLGKFFTMWEVEHWDPEPPIDPILLQRISNNLFVVVASWDTTPLERSILRGMYR